MLNWVPLCTPKFLHVQVARLLLKKCVWISRLECKFPLECYCTVSHLWYLSDFWNRKIFFFFFKVECVGIVLSVRGVKTYVTGTAVSITHLDAAFLCPVCFIPRQLCERQIMALWMRPATSSSCLINNFLKTWCHRCHFCKFFLSCLNLI